MASFVVRDHKLTHVHLEIPGERGCKIRVGVPVQGQGFFRTATLPDALADKVKHAHGKKMLRVKTAPAKPAPAVAADEPGPALSHVESVTLPASPQAKRGHGR